MTTTGHRRPVMTVNYWYGGRPVMARGTNYGSPPELQWEWEFPWVLPYLWEIWLCSGLVLRGWLVCASFTKYYFEIHKGGTIPPMLLDPPLGWIRKLLKRWIISSFCRLHARLKCIWGGGQGHDPQVTVEQLLIMKEANL